MNHVREEMAEGRRWPMTDEDGLRIQLEGDVFVEVEGEENTT